MKLLQPWVLRYLVLPFAAALVLTAAALAWRQVAEARETRLERDRLCLELYYVHHGKLAGRLAPPADACGEWRAAGEDRRFVRVTR